MKSGGRAVAIAALCGVVMSACAAEEAPSIGGLEQALAGAPSRCGGRGGKSVQLSPLGSHRAGPFAEGAAEIVAHDPDTQRLFVVNAAAARVDVLDIRIPNEPTLVKSLDLTAYGSVVNSVDVHDGKVAAAVEAEEKTDPGRVVLLDAKSLDTIAVFQVGALPDMLTFSKSGRYLVVANEGEPNDDYSIDPEGSVSIIDVRRGTVRTAGFAGFTRAQLDPRIRTFGPNASVAQDLEPEYVTISEDEKRAWVTLQEANALAIVDLAKARVEKIVPLGEKDHEKRGNGLDASDKDGAIAIESWPVRGMYMPDAIASYRVHGETYLVLANEGDARDYEGFSEEARVKSLKLDPTRFPNAKELQADERLGRLKVTNTRGDLDGDGDYDVLYSFGARSFSIRNANGGLVYDSGDALERITAAEDPELFNSDHEANAFDDRSDDKGPEPEALTIGKVRGRTYAFIGLERQSGIVTYDVSEPSAPCYVDYVNLRNASVDPESAEAGDLGPEGMHFIDGDESPNGKPLLVVANEISGTTTLYEVRSVRE